MKFELRKCEHCKEETKFTHRKTFAHKGRSAGHYLKREVIRCCECGRTSVKNVRTKNTYIKKMGGEV